MKYLIVFSLFLALSLVSAQPIVDFIHLSVHPDSEWKEGDTVYQHINVDIKNESPYNILSIFLDHDDNFKVKDNQIWGIRILDPPTNYGELALPENVSSIPINTTYTFNFINTGYVAPTFNITVVRY
ncbi:hypothetical protein DLAC_01145 [Tieghemostelium lacteum]|uniref:Carbohydrate binding domain-containing protein n=1 Tax=Tieghemostelium lacteum TaxID=361077 RepID=A0A152A7U8_TIELA|nr:hypothetical protein DLAC_01145 [Tieghemostelium lacteum]|eukprot:KYR02313.1 hypothetical protein DLAC_01145 [Tieghemostelium lacteum]